MTLPGCSGSLCYSRINLGPIKWLPDGFARGYVYSLFSVTVEQLQMEVSVFMNNSRIVNSHSRPARKAANRVYVY